MTRRRKQLGVTRHPGTECSKPAEQNRNPGMCQTGSWIGVWNTLGSCNVVNRYKFEFIDEGASESSKSKGGK